MRYWWVNQNQTFEQEFNGGYIWSPKRRKNNSRNPFYEYMREVSPGDIVLSFNNTMICAVSVAASYCYESPKPEEFGSIGSNWSDIGWKVDINYAPMLKPVRPADFIELLRPLLPPRYSPL
ncbi:MAG: HNH endonuclease, partial [Pseudomonadales bacterium]